MDEVVVIGYGTVRKRDLTGSVVSVSGEDIAAVPVTSAAQALQGRLAGVNVVSQDGRPDASISIRVRGGGSISQSNEPLYVVDGFPVSSISDIPGNIIERIDILKDASSTAIYGARGANGVILITTKEAKGEKVTVSYNGYYQYKTPVKYLAAMNAYDYIAYNWAYADAYGGSYREAWEMLWAIGPYSSFTAIDLNGEPITVNNPAGIDFYKNVAAKNMTKEVYGDASAYNHNVTVSSGSDKTKFMFTADYLHDNGLKINSYLDRANASVKIDQKISSSILFRFDARYSQMVNVGNETTRGQGGNAGGGGSVLSTAYRFRPIATEDVRGILDDRINTGIGMFYENLQDQFNPVARIKDYLSERISRNLRGNASLSWDIVKDLTARTEIGLRTSWGRNRTWEGAIYRNYFDALGDKQYSGDATLNRSEGYDILWSNTLNYKVSGLGENHKMDVLAGYEINSSGRESMEIFGAKYPVSFSSDRAFAMMNQYDQENASVNHSIRTNNPYPDRIASFFGRVNYNFKERYLLTATFRADGSSRFAPTNRWGYFPAAAFAWRMSEESFMKDINWLDNMKLKLSYGSVGNDGISQGLWKMEWASSGLLSYSINNVQQLGYSPANTTMSNPYLTWETTITRNLGIEYGIFKNRIYGSVDVYWNSTKDLLMRTQISAISGFTYTYKNVGQTSNKGIEIVIGADILRHKDYSLSFNTNINFNKGNIDKLAEGVNGLYGTGWASTGTRPSQDYILKEGHPVGLVRGYVYEGFYTTDDFTYSNGVYTLKPGLPDAGSVLGSIAGTEGVVNKPAGQNAYPGSPKYKDISGPNGTPNGIIDEFDADIIGDMNPIHTGGFNIIGRYKSWDLGMNFAWSYGNNIYNTTKLAAFMGDKNYGLFRNRFDIMNGAYKFYDIQGGNLVRVREPAELNNLNRNAKAYNSYMENAVVSTFCIEDGSYLRLNTLTLGYTLPKLLIAKVMMQRARAYCTISNVFTLTGYSGLDPEVNTNANYGGSSYPTTGLDYGAYPRARTFTFGINIEF